LWNGDVVFGDRKNGRREGEETAEIIVGPEALVRVLLKDELPCPKLAVAEENIVLFVCLGLCASITVTFRVLAPSVCTQCATRENILLVPLREGRGRERLRQWKKARTFRKRKDRTRSKVTTNRQR
jgi:hypothetical protein